MASKGVIVLPQSLSAQQRLYLANVYLEDARRADDLDITFVLCHDAEESLLHAKSVAKNHQPTLDDIATAYSTLGELLVGRRCFFEANAFRKKAEEVRRHTKPVSPSGQQTQPNIPTPTPVKNVSPSITGFKLPEVNERVVDTQQLVSCLKLLEAPYSKDDELEPVACKWLEAIRKDPDEQERLKTMATEVVRAFKGDALKDEKVVSEVVSLTPVLSKDDFKKLLRVFYNGIDHSGLLDAHLLNGMSQLIRGARPGYLDPDCLDKILGLINTRFQGTRKESEHYSLLATLVSDVQNAMADAHLHKLNREIPHEPPSAYP
ncbi:hypothetical protein BGX34_003157, partial [Mortierella sp. NVP85]